MNYVQPISLNDMNVPVNALTDPLFGKRILHGATFPEKLIEPLIKVGSKVGDTVLDPFCGTGTTGKVSLSNGRKSIGYEINPSFNEIIKQKLIDFSIDELSLTGS